jgi:ferric-dicitrate binding protein FerR (iron transport regulator)
VSAGIITATLLFVAVAAFLFAPTHESAPLPEPRVITTEAGEQTRVQLSDSSSVRLNAESQLTVSPSFGDERRVVRLQGEAYFDVKSGAPFIVKARDTRVRVLGTAFGVRSYSSADQVSIVVKEGKVGVDAREDAALERTLGPQQRAVVSSTGGVEVRSVLLSRYLGWRHGRLVFRSTPLRAVMQSLERQYGLQTFLLDDPLADRELTATFSDEPLSEVLRVIALSLEVGYRHSDSTVVFGRPESNALNVPSAADSSSR